MIRDKMPEQPAVTQGPARPDSIAPVPRRSPPPGNTHQEMLKYLYDKLKEQFPGVADNDLWSAAQKLLTQIRTQQNEEFNKLFFPERLQQIAATQQMAPQPPMSPQQGMVAQNEQRPWKYSPGAPGGIEYTDTPEYKARQQQQQQKAIADGQMAHAKQQAAQQARQPTRPGQAQPVQPPAQGTPYNPSQQPEDPEVAALNAAEKANSPGIPKRYFRNPDGTLGIAQ